MHSPIFEQPEMANISVRRIDNETMERLRQRASQHGISMEEEVRRILQHAVSAPDRIGDVALEMFGPAHGVDIDLPEHDRHEPVDPGA